MRILIADDEKEFVKALSVLLRNANYSVDFALDGEEAMDCLHGASYDAVILDINMPKMNGYEAAKMIRSLDKLVKFVGIALIPIGIILFVQSFFFNGEPFRGSITSMVAAVIGMIPEGLYLLASVALAVKNCTITMILSVPKVRRNISSFTKSA